MPEPVEIPPDLLLVEATFEQIFSEISRRTRGAVMAIVTPARHGARRAEWSSFSWHGGVYCCEGLARGLLRRLARHDLEMWNEESGEPKPPDIPI